MKNKLCFIFTLFFLNFKINSLNSYPIFSFSTGLQKNKVNINKDITLIEPLQNNYFSNKNNQEITFEVFAGFEFNLNKNLLNQLGFGYYDSNRLKVSGKINQFADPNFNNLNFSYFIQAKRLILENKFLFNYKLYYPYAILGIGKGFTRSYGYKEDPIVSGVEPMYPGFKSNKVNSMLTLWGFGLDRELNNKLRLGISFRQSKISNTNLGLVPEQESNTKIAANNLKFKEYFLQLSYLGNN